MAARWGGLEDSDSGCSVQGMCMYVCGGGGVSDMLEGWRAGLRDDEENINADGES